MAFALTTFSTQTFSAEINSAKITYDTGSKIIPLEIQLPVDYTKSFQMVSTIPINRSLEESSDNASSVSRFIRSQITSGFSGTIERVDTELSIYRFQFRYSGKPILKQHVIKEGTLSHVSQLINEADIYLTLEKDKPICAQYRVPAQDKVHDHKFCVTGL